MKNLIEALLTTTTLAGYWMVTHGLVFLGAVTAGISNILWLFYGATLPQKSWSLLVVNAVFLMINLNIMGE